MKNKILIVTSVASMIDQFTKPTIELLLSLGYEVHVACNFIIGNTCSLQKVEQLKHYLTRKNVYYHQIDFDRNVFNFQQIKQAFNQLEDLCLKNDFKFIHCHSPIGGFISRIVGKKCGIKVIYTAHGFHFFDGASIKNWIVFYNIEKWLSRYTDVLITINKEDYQRAQKFNAKKVCYVPGVGIDTKQMMHFSGDFQYLIDEFTIKNTDRVFLSVGELNENKNHKVIIEALGKMNIKDFKYFICGQGHLKDELINLAKKYNIEDNIIFTGFRSDIFAFYKISDYFLFPSYREGLSVALMEAMAFGLPVCCSNIRGNNDLIVEKEGGFLFSPSSIDSAVSALKSLLEEDKNKLGKFNQNYIKQFDNEIVLNMLHKIYRNME